MHIVNTNMVAIGTIILSKFGAISKARVGNYGMNCTAIPFEFTPKCHRKYSDSPALSLDIKKGNSIPTHREISTRVRTLVLSARHH